MLWSPAVVYRLRPSTQAVNIDTEWVYELVRRCQILLCGLDAPADASAPSLANLLKAMPGPANRVEQLLLQGLFFEVVIGSLRHHSSAPLDEVAFVEDALRAAWARRQGSMTAAAKAAALIEANYARDLRVPELARQVGCHQSTLRAGFRREFAMSLKQYHARVRIGIALRLFNEGNTKGVSLSCLVGYRSERNFYRAFRQVTGCTPHALSSLSRDEREDLMTRVAREVDFPLGKEY